MRSDRGHGQSSADGRHTGDRPRLPLVLVAADGHEPVSPPPGLDAGVLLRDTDLGAVIERSAFGGTTLALDIDTVRGLNSDAAAVDFVLDRLRIRIVMTRRPQTAAHVAERGGLGLLHVLAFDSTGLARSLEGHPHRDGIGTIVSPGLVLTHMLSAEVQRLPRPVVAYGLLARADDALACLELADSIVLGPDAASRFAASRGPMWHSAGNPLTTVAARE